MHRKSRSTETFWFGALSGVAFVASVATAKKLFNRQKGDGRQWFAWMPLAQVGFDGRRVFTDAPTGWTQGDESLDSESIQQAEPEPIRFAYNYGYWPFVEMGLDGEKPIRERISASLTGDIQKWATEMMLVFDMDKGFPSAETKERLNAEYLALSQRLKDEGVDNVTDLWWS